MSQHNEMATIMPPRPSPRFEPGDMLRAAGSLIALAALCFTFPVLLTVLYGVFKDSGASALQDGSLVFNALLACGAGAFLASKLVGADRIGRMAREAYLPAAFVLIAMARMVMGIGDRAILQLSSELFDPRIARMAGFAERTSFQHQAAVVVIVALGAMALGTIGRMMRQEMPLALSENPLVQNALSERNVHANGQGLSKEYHE